MPRHQRLLTAKTALNTVVCSGLVFLAGCSSAGGSEAAPSPTPSATHFFESEAAAIERMQRLVAEADEAETLAVNSFDDSMLDDVYTSDSVVEVKQSLAKYIENDVKSYGAFADRNFRIVRLVQDDNGVEIVLSFCRNVAGTGLELSDGTDITPTNRPIEQSLEVTGYFDGHEGRLSAFRPSETDECSR